MTKREFEQIEEIIKRELSHPHKPRHTQGYPCPECTTNTAQDQVLLGTFYEFENE